MVVGRGGGNISHFSVGSIGGRGVNIPNHSGDAGGMEGWGGAVFLTIHKMLMGGRVIILNSHGVLVGHRVKMPY